MAYDQQPVGLPIGAVEQLVSRHRGRAWQACEIRDMTEYASHPCAILSGGAEAVFAKFSSAADGLAQFEAEVAGLQILSERAGILTPAPIGIDAVAGGAILVLEAVQAVARTPHHWRQIGRTLARIHSVKGTHFGLERQVYFGPLPQDNTPAATWPTFYGERRLRSGLRMAVDAGHLPSTVARQVETLIARLPDLCGPVVAPTLLHGDAQRNNYISSAAGTVVIDPAVYYGHPEMDLAYLDYFQPVPDEVFAGYQEEMAIDPGFWQRRDLWRIWANLAMVTVGGPAYVGALVESVRKYL